MTKKSGWSMEKVEGVAFGMFVSSLFFVCLFWCLDVVEDKSKADHVVALAAIIGTVGAAWLALIGIRKQVQDARDIETENREAAHVAARAMLPLALTRLHKVCDNNIRRNYDPADLLFRGTTATSLMECDSETISTLKEAINATSPSNRERLAHIIRLYQVVLARTDMVNGEPPAKPHEDDITDDYERNRDAINWATVQAVVAHAFPYARNTTKDIPAEIEVDEVRTCLLNAGLDFDVFPNLGSLYGITKDQGRMFAIM